jgi:4-carboxymuconolactone decarboxylase
MALMMDMRRHVANRSLLSPQLTEIPILIAAREWTQQYEWNAHEAIAMKAGLKAEIINAIKEGRRPRQMTEQEESLYEMCMELQRTKSVSDPTYARAMTALGGEDKVIEAVAIQGYYALLAMVMNTARTALPAGAKPPLPAFPR